VDDRSSIAGYIRANLDRQVNLRDKVTALGAIVRYRIVDDPDLLHEVQRMRYRSYLREGAVDARDTGTLDDRYDDGVNTATFALFFADRLCASIRLNFAYSGCRETPACDAFPDELGALLDRGERIIDPNCFCVDPALAGIVPEFAYLTLRLPYIAATLRRRTTVVATARAEHMAFYRRVLRCRVVSPPRIYAGRLKPLGLMMVDFDAEGEAIARRNPFFLPGPGEARALGLARVDGGLAPLTGQDEELIAWAS
jgi:hypothetical protein